MVLFEDFKFNKSFSQLAKESNFTFNLYRGRVDWKKLESLDVDRMVRDQDVELLYIHTSCVTNCNLESEYDVKIFDPNFIKLFRLAQLLIDFLLHCKQYLESCIKVACEGLQASNKEVDILRKQLHARKAEVKKLRKKIKEVKQQLLPHTNISPTTFQCSLCGKVFLNNIYLQGHLIRRHSMTQPEPQLVPSNVETQQSQSKMKQSETNLNESKPEDAGNGKKKYQEEIDALKNVFFAEIEKLKQTETLKTQTSGGDFIQTDVCDASFGKENMRNLKENNQINTEKDDEWQKRMEEREGVWRSRLSAIDHQYKMQISQLQEKLENSVLQGREMKNDLECRLEQAVNKFEKCQALMESKLKAAEEISQKAMTDKMFSPQTQSPVSIDLEKPVEENINSIPKENPQKSLISKQPRPFQRRKAFISQKSKTVQEDMPEQSPPQTIETNDLVKVFKSDEESFNEEVDDDRNVTIQQQNTGKKDKNDSFGNNIVFPFLQMKENNNGGLGSNQLSEDITTILLEENRKNVIMKNNESKTRHIDEGSSLSETLSETESERSSMEHNGVSNRLIASKAESNDLLKTETQLTQQSLASMEALLAANPKIMEQLRDDLKQLLARRLQGLGVDPDWAGLPPGTFRHKIDLLAHQRRITAKSHKVYFTLRDKLNRDADAAVKSHPLESMADTLLSRLRNKAAVVIDAAKFTQQIGMMKNKGDSISVPLAASSPKFSPNIGQKNISRAPIISAAMLSSSKDSLSLSSSTFEEDEEEEEKPESKQMPHAGSVKSALRNAMSTGNLAKKKVLFVDQEITEEKRSLSDNSVGMIPSVPANVSVASLLNDIQQQLNESKVHRANYGNIDEKLNTSLGAGLSLSQILPLSKSGRELLESEHLHTTTSNIKNISKAEKTPVTLQPLSHIVKKVPIARPSVSELKVETKTSGGKDLLQPLKLSPVPSITSISSSLLDISLPASPRGLHWDLQDLEENLKD